MKKKLIVPVILGGIIIGVATPIISAPVTVQAAYQTSVSIGGGVWYQGQTIGYGYIQSGGPVIVLQYMLNKTIHAGLETDGKFGPKTEAAVRSFQKTTGYLTQDGIAGVNTFKALVVYWNA